MLFACAAPWAYKIAEMKATWRAEAVDLYFTVTGDSDRIGIGFGRVIDSNGEEKAILFDWNYTTISFLVLLTHGETDESVILSANDIVLFGKYSYHNKSKGQVKLSISLNDERHPDKLFGGQYETIILSAT